MKKTASFILAAVLSLAVLTAPFSRFAAEVHAASEDEKLLKSMLPYYCRQLGKEETEAYLKIRSAVIKEKESLAITIKEDSLIKILCIMYTSDPLTCFNMDFENLTWSRNSSTRYSDRINFSYKYSLDTYNSIITRADLAADEVISGFGKDFSDYDKLKHIHDYIINKCDYRLTGPHISDIYGALCLNTAKCDGYAHTFNYICMKAGFPSVTVISRPEADGSSHAWNKVKCGGKWYNADLTWDDPFSQLTDNSFYTYFMLSDEQIFRTHPPLTNLGLEYPAAEDDSLSYFSKNGLMAFSESDIRSILPAEIAKAADNGKFKVMVQLADGMSTSFLSNEVLMHKILSSADKKTQVKLITDGCYCRVDDQNILTVQFFKKDTWLSEYITDPQKLDADTKRFFRSIGLKF